MENSECNCFIGYLNSYNMESTKDLYLNDFVDKITCEVKTVNLLNKELYQSNKIVKPLDYFDRRKGFSRLFNYCPNCGKKIDWKKIKENFK